MATDRELADAAWHEITLTTDSYPTYVKKGKPATSHFSKAKALLDQIDVAPPPPPPSDWPYESRIGVSAASEPSQGDMDRTKELSVSAGKKLPMRVDVYAVGPYMKQMESAISQGFDIMGIMYGTFQPSESPGDQVGNPPGWPTRGTPEWAGYVANYYKGKIKMWEIMNEPDGQGWSAVNYAKFAVAAALKIEAADPAAKISTGGIYKATAGITMPDFTRAIVAELKRIGRPDLFDFFAGHPYDPMGWNDPRNQWHMTYRYGDRAAGDTMREVLDANGMASVPIISTEYANAQQFTDETSQANDLAPKLAMVKPSGLHAGFFFTTNPNAWPQYQLYNPDGSKRKSWYLVRDAAKNTSF